MSTSSTREKEEIVARGKGTEIKRGERFRRCKVRIGKQRFDLHPRRRFIPPGCSPESWNKRNALSEIERGDGRESQKERKRRECKNPLGGSTQHPTISTSIFGHGQLQLHGISIMKTVRLLSFLPPLCVSISLACDPYAHTFSLSFFLPYTRMHAHIYVCGHTYSFPFFSRLPPPRLRTDRTDPGTPLTPREHTQRNVTHRRWTPLRGENIKLSGRESVRESAEVIVSGL